MDTVIPANADWNEDFQEWLKPFLAVFKRSSNVAGHTDTYKDL
jgi:hypothetical protein